MKWPTNLFKHQLAAQVKTMIFDSLQYLPQDAYGDDEVQEKAALVYQHVFASYNCSVAAGIFPWKFDLLVYLLVFCKTTLKITYIKQIDNS